MHAVFRSLALDTANISFMPVSGLVVHAMCSPHCELYNVG